jgi:hypothetical protein
MSATNDTMQGMIRSGEDPVSRGGNDIQVELSEKEFNAYFEGEGGETRWLVRRTGGAEFHDGLVNTYKWLDLGGSWFEIRKIVPQGTNKILLTVVQSDMDPSPFLG